MSFTQCFSQMYFYWMSSGIEDTLLFTMAFDRYVAICKPLHYHLVFSRKNYLKVIAGIWISGCLNSLSVTVSAVHMNFCQSNTILQFFCDAKALANIACAITDAFYAVIYFNLFLLGLCPCVFSLSSYVKIIRVILSIKSKGGRRKAFSTCSSHLSVLLLYYGTGLPVYLSPSSNHTTVLAQTFSVFYTMVTPMLNPLIYSLRNEEVKKALLKLISHKTSSFYVG
ncbi:olfactory receptor 1-like [Hyla sarda]|uniref:olfactory receptor 1-like n=1 Tax=Hyla sarda TaxID=327740 RepID=UPI0024C38AF3|nr:olfactory receptor 1-like [Hyla sarda]